jgi:putative ABC transport system substrate-binding protein
VPRIGLLGGLSAAAPAFQKYGGSFLEGLRELGWIERQTIVIEYRFAEGRPDRLPELAAELVRLNFDLIVPLAFRAVFAAREATNTIPIVMPVSTDPVRNGIVASLSRPGGNITGLSSDVAPTVAAKMVQFLKEIRPTMSRLAILGVFTHAQVTQVGGYLEAAERAGALMGVSPAWSCG